MVLGPASKSMRKLNELRDVTYLAQFLEHSASSYYCCCNCHHQYLSYCSPSLSYLPFWLLIPLRVNVFCRLGLLSHTRVYFVGVLSEHVQ